MYREGDPVGGRAADFARRFGVPIRSVCPPKPPKWMFWKQTPTVVSTLVAESELLVFFWDGRDMKDLPALRECQEAGTRLRILRPPGR